MSPRPLPPLVALLFCAPFFGCSLGQGVGEVKSDRLIAKDCWGEGATQPEDDDYDMQPDFFAAVPYRETLQIRVQRGNDIQEVSDGLGVLIDDVEPIRQELRAKRDAGSGEPVRRCVSLPPGVVPPGSAPSNEKCSLCAEDEVPSVHMSLYLQRSCHNQNTVLYAVCGTILFNALFSGDPNEEEAVDKLTDVPEFRIQVADPRDAPLGGTPLDVPAEQQSEVHGYFNFYFERGQPGQPFP
jgi:hypothetical protein